LYYICIQHIVQMSTILDDISNSYEYYIVREDAVREFKKFMANVDEWARDARASIGSARRFHKFLHSKMLAGEATIPNEGSSPLWYAPGEPAWAPDEWQRWRVSKAFIHYLCRSEDGRQAQYPTRMPAGRASRAKGTIPRMRM